MSRNQDKQPKKSSTTEGNCSTRRCFIRSIINYLVSNNRWTQLDEVHKALVLKKNEETDLNTRDRLVTNVAYIEFIQTMKHKAYVTQLMIENEVDELTKIESHLLSILLKEGPMKY